MCFLKTTYKVIAYVYFSYIIDMLKALLGLNSFDSDVLSLSCSGW